MDGAIKCLEMFASGDNLSDQHLPQLIPLLFPHLLRVFSSVSCDRLEFGSSNLLVC
jgi:hypothetical protein